MEPVEDVERYYVVERQGQEVERCSRCKVASRGIALWANRICVAAMALGVGLGVHVTLGLLTGAIARHGVSALLRYASGG
jgi:hypothetical protein